MYWNRKVDSHGGSTQPIYRLYKKIVKIKVVENWISYEIVSDCTCLSLLGVELGVSKDRVFEILECTEMGKWIHFRAQCCQNYWLYQKIIQIKVVENWISYKKVSGDTCLSLPAVELGDSKDWYVSNIILYWNGKVGLFLGSMLPKIRIYQKMLWIKVLVQ